MQVWCRRRCVDQACRRSPLARDSLQGSLDEAKPLYRGKFGKDLAVEPAGDGRKYDAGGRA
eukprot:4789285-Alexandrium_andersonii.AAC.1